MIVARPARRQKQLPRHFNYFDGKFEEFHPEPQLLRTFSDFVDGRSFKVDSKFSTFSDIIVHTDPADWS
jgi:hypothetical protein